MGTINSSFNATATSELGDTIPTVTVNVTGDAVASRTFSVGTPSINLNRFLVTATPTGTTSVTSTGVNTTTENASVGTFSAVSGLGLTTADPTAFNGAASQTANYAVSGHASTAGNISGTFTANVTSELGDTIAPIQVTVSGDAVNTRTFTTPGAINLGRFLITAPHATTTVSSSGLNNVTENATLGTFTGTGTGITGLTLTAATNAFNGGAATQTDTLTLGGTPMAAGTINGSFSSTVTSELGDTIAPVTVSVTGDAVATRTFTVGGGGTIALGRFLVTATPVGSATVSSTGANAVTENATLGTFSSVNGLNLGLTSGTALFAGASGSAQTNTYTVAGKGRDRGRDQRHLYLHPDGRIRRLADAGQRGRHG